LGIRVVSRAAVSQRDNVIQLQLALVVDGVRRNQVAQTHQPMACNVLHEYPLAQVSMLAVISASGGAAGVAGPIVPFAMLCATVPRGLHQPPTRAAVNLFDAGFQDCQT